MVLAQIASINIFINIFVYIFVFIVVCTFLYICIYNCLYIRIYLQVKAEELTFRKTSRHHSGVYTCSADNGWGSAAQARIVLDVQVKWIDFNLI